MQTISSLTEESNEARACNLHYATALDELLREFNWPFARRYATLSLIEEADAQPWSEQWSYMYGLPVDAIAVRRILNGSSRIDTDPVPFQIAFDGNDTVLFTDQSPASVEYTARVTDPNRFDIHFSMALSWLLASKIAKPLSRSDREQEAAIQKAAIMLKVAEGHSANYGRSDKAPDSEFIRSRT